MIRRVTKRVSLSCFLFTILLLLCLPLASSRAQELRKVAGSLGEDLKQFVETPAIPGHEKELAEKIRSRLAAFRPAMDSLGSVIVTIGSGAPHRLLVAPLDEPGYVVSEITGDGYLRVQRLPQFGLPPVFDELYLAQPVKIGSASGKWIDGVFAGLSVHLQPERKNPPNSSDLDNMYVDIGANSAEEVRRAGVDVLDPIVMDRTLQVMAYGKLSAAGVGDRFGAAALVELARTLDPAKLKGTLTLAFVAQQWTGARGLERLLEEVKPDEMIFVGRLTSGNRIAGTQGLQHAPRREPGSGVLIGLEGTDGTLSGLAAEIKKLADASKIPVAADFSAPLLPPSYLPAPKLPERAVHLGIAAAWPATPSETIDFPDLSALANLLEAYIFSSEPVGIGFVNGSGAAEPPATIVGRWVSGGAEVRRSAARPSAEILRNLVEEYGVSGHEGPVRDRVDSLLPPWAKTETDAAGNLVLRAGTAPPGAKTTRILVVAHLDEIGFEVKVITNEGRLEVEWRGGGNISFFAGHPVYVMPGSGVRLGVLELPNGWDQPGFEWPRGRQAVIRVDVGARTREEVEKLGINVGDSITIPKKYRPLLGTRANGRSFDDRVGCAALISAVWELGGPLKDRDVTFVWSTGEEEGLLGAAAAAKRLAAERRTPDYVFAVDTFVSSDSPLESKRFADATLGKGFVIRAVDNSNIVPPQAVERLLDLARKGRIPAQYGVTGGGNDGSAFLRYGSVDVALGWPLRYSHSPAEVIDTRDLDALARIIAAIAREW
jgi:putative aminopeptidase FrvX